MVVDQRFFCGEDRNGGKAFAARRPVDACDENLPSTAVHLPLAMIELVCQTFVHTAVVDIF